MTNLHQMVTMRQLVPPANQQTSRETFVLKTPFRAAGRPWSIQIKQIKLSQMAKEVVVGPPT